MVRKIVFLLLITTTAQAGAPGLALQWQGAKPPECHKLIEIFLAELRSMATDRIIELEAIASATPRHPAEVGGKKPRTLAISCQGKNSVAIAEGDDSLNLRYLAKAAGFDANDWLPFQQKYLRAPAAETSLAPVAQAELAMPSAPPTEMPRELNDHGSVFQSWWFWSLVGAAGAGAYALTRSSSGNATGNVEIH